MKTTNSSTPLPGIGTDDVHETLEEIVTRVVFDDCTDRVRDYADPKVDYGQIFDTYEEYPTSVDVCLDYAAGIDVEDEEDEEEFPRSK